MYTTVPVAFRLHCYELGGAGTLFANNQRCRNAVPYFANIYVTFRQNSVNEKLSETTVLLVETLRNVEVRPTALPALLTITLT